MLPELGASIAGGLFGLLGSGVSAISGGRANKRAMKIAQMNNEFQEREAVKNRNFIDQQRQAQNDWNLEQWNRESEYNSASSQRERLEEAGLNPYLMMSGGSAGSATSASSTPASTGGSPTGSPSMPNIRPISVDFSGVSDAISSYFVNRNLSSETIGKQLTNLNLPDLLRSEIAKNIGGQFEWLSDDYGRRRKDMSVDLLGVDVNQKLQGLEVSKSLTKLNLANSVLTTLRAEAQKILNDHLDDQQVADLAIKAATAYERHISGNFSEERIRTEIASQAKLYAETNGRRIENRKAEALADSYIAAFREEYESNQAYYSTLKKYGSRLANAKIENNELEVEMNRIQKRLAQYDQYGGYFLKAILDGVNSTVGPARKIKSIK